MTAPARSLRERIFSVVPAASFGMDKLLALADVVPSERVATAAVECLARPRLLVNPAFIAGHCATNEHLFMLVMHELHHVLLGHTRLFGRPTPAHNIAFDAIINAMLCRRFPGAEFTSFFQQTNSWDAFPGRLLRPPPGWPARPRPLPDDAPPLERNVHDLLYGRNGAITYREVFELLVRLLGKRGSEVRRGEPLLLGDHDGQGGASAQDGSAEQDDLLVGALQRVAEGWPAPGRSLTGSFPSAGGAIDSSWFLRTSVDPSQRLRAALRRLLARAGVHASAGHRGRRRRARETAVDTQTVLPQLTDRRAHAWRRLHGATPILWNGSARQARRRPDPRPVAHVYLDVSGSMDGVLPHLGAVLRAPHRTGAIRLFVFSTVVDEARPGDLATQVLANTGGTDIRCVLEHLGAMPERRRPRRVVLLTDGYVGNVDAAELEQLRVALYVGLNGDAAGGGARSLVAVARHVTVLPGL